MRDGENRKNTKGGGKLGVGARACEGARRIRAGGRREGAREAEPSGD